MLPPLSKISFDRWPTSSTICVRSACVPRAETMTCHCGNCTGRTAPTTSTKFRSLRIERPRTLEFAGIKRVWIPIRMPGWGLDKRQGTLTCSSPSDQRVAKGPPTQARPRVPGASRAKEEEECHCQEGGGAVVCTTPTAKLNLSAVTIQGLDRHLHGAVVGSGASEAHRRGGARRRVVCAIGRQRQGPDLRGDRQH